eukprot:gnl/TRDRNA2_/TRDRNA2_54160_c0_seq1.p1 gnl/TRDRNA2_/TRDRNA2_54160_c0~~gnl/TRDRNA2_/TRDRNA2_54160_c0_seq1.p1  ORF type:complete len:616 (+),score=85.96 gnl/TRDRNA2_/TRDRNA2_54160_c0_seq1:257-1849(+)
MRDTIPSGFPMPLGTVADSENDVGDSSARACTVSTVDGFTSSRAATASVRNSTAAGIGRGGDLVVDIDQLLQELLLQQGLFDEDDTVSDGIDAVFHATGTCSSNGLNPAATLREMRRTGPLGELSQDAQRTLLGSTLYEYTDTSDLRQSQSQCVGPTTPSATQASCTLTATAATSSGPEVPERQDANAARPALASSDEDQDDGESVATGSGNASPSPSPCGLDLLRLSLDRILRTHSRGGGRDVSVGAGHNGTGHGYAFPWETLTDTARSGWSVRTVASPAGDLDTTRSREDHDLTMQALQLSNSFSVASEQHPFESSTSTQDRATSAELRTAVRQTDGEHLLASDMYEVEDEDTVSVRGLDSPQSARSRRDGAGNTSFDETQSLWGFGDTARSSLSNSQSESVQQSARTVFGETLTIEGGLDGGLAGVLQRLALEDLSLDESLTGAVRRVLQLGTVLTGQRLTEEEIRTLPKVRFDQAEQQNCAICLEPYQKGELLTALRCTHFFHVDCIAKWMQRATQCPLCRQECAD